MYFEPWDQMLRHYVDDQGRVNYASWTDTLLELESWLQSIATGLPQPNSGIDYQLAFWINAYNALCIYQVLKIYPIRSIRPTILGIPNWIAFLWFFMRPGYLWGDRRYNLNTIEHKILRPNLNDPRIHFALVCAAVGCPLLRNEAYWPDRVQTQLDEDAQRFIQNPTKVCYEARQNILYCSKIFKWYRRDFLTPASSIPDYIQWFLTAPTPMSSSVQVRYLDYDWSLNQRTSS